jgi:hypothetical protein
MPCPLPWPVPPPNKRGGAAKEGYKALFVGSQPVSLDAAKLGELLERR